jgi:hypothetical protein
MAHSFLGIIELVSRDDRLANRKSIRAWASNLPLNDPVGAIDSVIDVLESPAATQEEVSIGRAQAILELDRIAAPWHAQLRAQYRLSSMSDEVRERLWFACDRVARAFAQAHERVCVALSGDGTDDKARIALHGAFARLFFHIGLQTRHGLFRYERWIPRRWRLLHSAYSEACRQGIVAEPYVLDRAAEPGTSLSPEHEYLQILLLHRLNTGNLSALQVDQAAEWLRGSIALLGLAMKQPEGDGYWLDLGHGDGLLAQQPEQHTGELLYLDVGPLRGALQQLETRLQSQVQSIEPRADIAELEHQIELVRRLSTLWFPQAPHEPRRGERHLQQRTVTVALGWQEIAPALSISALQRSQAPAGYHYDDYGRLRPDRDRVLPVPESRRRDLNIWQVMDASESGYRIRTTAHHEGPLRLGALLALKLEDEARWQLGIVRRLKRLTAEQTELGVEVISRSVALIAPKPLAQRDTGYTVDGIDVGLKGKSFHALFLPGQSRARGGSRPSIVLPAAEFSVGRGLSLNIDGHPHEVVLAPPIERTKDWIWTPLDLGSKTAGASPLEP